MSGPFSTFIRFPFVVSISQFVISAVLSGYALYPFCSFPPNPRFFQLCFYCCNNFHPIYACSTGYAPTINKSTHASFTQKTPNYATLCSLKKGPIMLK